MRLLCAVDVVYTSAHRLCMPRVRSDDERPGMFAWGRGVGQTDTSPVWWRGAHISNQTRTQFRFIRTVRFAVCDIHRMFHVKQFASHTVSGISYLRILAVFVVLL